MWGYFEEQREYKCSAEAEHFLLARKTSAKSGLSSKNLRTNVDFLVEKCANLTSYELPSLAT
ncbi:hypothetical protein PAJ34TS1_59890 [Paenibacillus azoreducens]